MRNQDELYTNDYFRFEINLDRSMVSKYTYNIPRPDDQKTNEIYVGEYQYSQQGVENTLNRSFPYSLSSSEDDKV